MSPYRDNGEFEGRVLAALARVETAIANLTRRVDALESAEDTSQQRTISKLEAEITLAKNSKQEGIRLVLACLLGAILSLIVGILLK